MDGGGEYMKTWFLSAYKVIDGKKTYIIAGVCAALTFAKVIGWISASELETLIGIFGSIGLITIRDAIRKLE